MVYSQAAVEPIDDLVLGQMLLERGLIKPEELEQARAHAAQNQKSLAEILVAAQKIKLEDLSIFSGEHTIKTVHWQSPLLGGTKRVAPSVRADENLPADVQEMARKPEYLFDKFVLLGLLGRGGAGEVWKAWQRDLRRYVAIKFLESKQGVDLDRFFREAQTAASLIHQNITALYELNKHEGRYYIVMQFIDGVTLHQHAGKIPVQRACKLMREACLALDHAHKQGIIHRDIKPQNIMVDRAGRVFVMDFGLAKQAADQSGHTVAGQILGTPAYMSPEQAESRFHMMDRRSDVYSLGATMYSLVTGKPPVHGSTAMERLHQVIAGDIVPPRKHNPKIPPEVEGIILKAMEHEPAHRYQSAVAFAEDLRRFLDGEPVTAAGPSLGKAFRMTFRKHRVALLSAGVIALLAIVAGATYKAARSGTADSEEIRRKEEELARKEREAAEQRALAAARADLEKVKQAWGEMDRLLVREGESWERLTKQAEAVLKVAAEVIRQHPKFPDARVYLARAHLARLEYEDAEKALREAIEIDEKCEPAYAELGRLYHYWGHDVDIARDWMGKRASPQGDALRARCAGLLSKYLGFATDPYDKTLAQACVLYADKRFLDAAQVAGRAVEINGERWEAHFFRAKAFHRIGRDHDAEAHTERGAQLQRNNWMMLHLAAAVRVNLLWVHPGRKGGAIGRCNQLVGLRHEAPFLAVRAQYHLANNEAREADGNAAWILQHAPKRPEGPLLRAMVHLEEKKARDALAAVDEARKLDPTGARPHHQAALAYAQLQDVQGALDSFARAIELEPDLAEAYGDRGMILAQARRIDEGLVDLAKAAQIDLNLAQRHMNVLWSLQRYPDVVSEGRRYQELTPNDFFVHWFTGWAQVKTKNFIDALESLNSADRLMGSASRILFARGEAYFGLKKWQEAEQDFHRVVQINPDDGMAWSIRAFCFEGLGKYKQAAESMRRAIKEWPQLKGEYERFAEEWERRS